MKIYTFVTGLDIDGNPMIHISPIDFCPVSWTLIDTREIIFNIGKDEILKLATEAQAEIDMTSEQYEIEANADHVTSEQFPNV